MANSLSCQSVAWRILFLIGGLVVAFAGWWAVTHSESTPRYSAGIGSGYSPGTRRFWGRVVLILGLLMGLSVVAITIAERNNPNLRSVWSALRWFVLSMVASPPWKVTTPVGRIVQYVVDVLKPSTVAVLIAGLTSHMFSTLVARTSGKGRVRLKDHIVICGWSSKGNEIIQEIRGRKDEESQRRVVVLAPLAQSPTHDDLSSFVNGDPTEERDLRRAHIEQAVLGSGAAVDLESALRAAVRATFEFFEADKALVRLLFRDSYALGGRFEKHLFGIYEGFIGDLELLIRQGQKAGVIVKAPPRMVAFSVAALVGQIAHRRLVTDDGLKAAVVADFIVDLVMDGLRPR